MGKEDCIELEDVNYGFNDQPVLEHISFAVNSGDYLGIIGPNGGGKTTLIRIMLGLLKPTSGKIKIFGQEIHHFKARYKLGYVPQRAAHEEFYFPASVAEVVQSGRTAKVGLFRRYRQEDHAAIRQAMDIAEISQLKDRLIGELSGGERQRVFIARALAGEPGILILDEPVVGVDIASKDRFYAFLKHLNKEEKITIIFVSHDVGAIAHEVNGVLCLNRRLICHGSPQDYIKEDFLEQVYGRKVTSIFHNH
ncbi:MAG: metal ABC transporter ATP-binding protein [Nitrospirota bacterium]